ncbi:hypothetical protein EV175_000252 [Coemansia sp. RSA 1933]|nr:hypothetical protein EV175_000252 [Coemansia sp. RSA 1933]
MNSLLIIDNIQCIGDNCPKETDWLMYRPTAPALWTLGGIALAAGLFIPLRNRRGLALASGLAKERSATIALGLSMVLRAAIDIDFSHEVAIYSVSMFFNYFSGLCVFYSLLCHSRHIKTLFAKPSKKCTIVHLSTGGIASLFMLVLLVLGVVFMFHHPGHNSVSAGMRCLQTMLAMILAFTLTIAVAFVVRFKKHLRSRMTKCSITSTLLVFVLLELWASFMFARTFVGLNNPARRSETMFFLLNFFPLMLLSAVTLALGQPLTGVAADTSEEAAAETAASKPEGESPA